MAKNTEIKIRISTTTLMLKNCQEVYGHDDSMPYMADLYEVKGVNDEELVHLAKCSNDGWGGDTLGFERSGCPPRGDRRFHQEVVQVVLQATDT